MVYADSSKQYLSEFLKITKSNLVACGFESLTVDSTSGGVSLTHIPANAKYALCVVESTATGVVIRYLELGNQTPPTSSNGIPRSNLDVFDLQGYQNITNFRAIQTQSGTHSVTVQYYK